MACANAIWWRAAMALADDAGVGAPVMARANAIWLRAAMVLADGLAGGGFIAAVGTTGAMTESASWFVGDTSMGTELDV